MPSVCKTQQGIGTARLQVESRIDQEDLARHQPQLLCVLLEELTSSNRNSTRRNEMNDTHRWRQTNPEWRILCRTNDFFNMLFSELVTLVSNRPNPTGAPLRTHEEQALELCLLRPESWGIYPALRGRRLLSGHQLSAFPNCACWKAEWLSPAKEKAQGSHRAWSRGGRPRCTKLAPQLPGVSGPKGCGEGHHHCLEASWQILVFSKTNAFCYPATGYLLQIPPVLTRYQNFPCESRLWCVMCVCVWRGECEVTCNTRWCSEFLCWVQLISSSQTWALWTFKFKHVTSLFKISPAALGHLLRWWKEAGGWAAAQLPGSGSWNCGVDGVLRAWWGYSGAGPLCRSRQLLRLWYLAWILLRACPCSGRHLSSLRCSQPHSSPALHLSLSLPCFPTPTPGSRPQATFLPLSGLGPPPGTLHGSVSFLLLQDSFLLFKQKF